MVSTAQNHATADIGLQHIKAGNIALKKGNGNLALAHYIEAIKKYPNNHRYKIHLCEFLKNISFPNHEKTMQGVILGLLKTEGLDHQCLWQAWFSLLLKYPEMNAFNNLMNGNKYNISDLEKSLDNDFFITGLKKLFCANIYFEQSLIEIKTLIDTQKISSDAFNVAFDSYNARTENIMGNTTDFTLDYKINKTIPSLSTIEDKTSQDVQDQYEHSPYPRWTSYHVLPPPQKTEAEPYNHLIAGCGTGFSTCMTSMLNPHVRITALDLSRASLTYAKKKATKLNLQNIEFFQADILDLKKLDKEFDLIECSGVLHHMKDPIAGWRCLINKLSPNGKMHIGLYSELGRADVVAARQFIADNKFEATPTGIREAREAIVKLPNEHPARQVLERRDFYNLSGCRDLIFHVQEHRFTIDKIQQAMTELNLTFDGFNIDNNAIRHQYLKRFPDDKILSNLDNWAEFEKDNPTFFRGMYQFWCHLS